MNRNTHRNTHRPTPKQLWITLILFALMGSFVFTLTGCSTTMKERYSIAREAYNGALSVQTELVREGVVKDPEVILAMDASQKTAKGAIDSYGEIVKKGERFELTDIDQQRAKSYAERFWTGYNAWKVYLTYLERKDE